MFVVTENGKPCDCRNFSVHESWNRSEFATYKEAEEYLHLWLGIYSPSLRNIKNNEAINICGVEFKIMEKEK